MPNPFREVKVQPGYAAGRVITWTIDPAFNEPTPYVFTLESSEDPKFSEIILSKKVGDSFFAIDDSKLIQSFAESYLYRVKLELPNGTIYYSKSIFFDGGREDRHKYLMAHEITRKEILRMRLKTGRPGWLLKRKIYSAAVAPDLDPVSGVPLNNDTESFGTGFAGGYYPPLKFLFSRENHSDAMELNRDGTGTSQNKLMSCRMVGFPLISNKDVLVTGDDERYSFFQVNNRFFPGTDICIVQNCEVRIIPNTDPVYNIEIPWT